MQIRCGPAEAFGRGQLAYAATTLLLYHLSAYRSHLRNLPEKSSKQRPPARLVTESQPQREQRTASSPVQPGEGDSPSIDEGSTAAPGTHRPCEGMRTGTDGSAVHAVDPQKEPSSTRQGVFGVGIVDSYSAVWGAEPAVIRASAAFTWQACQKMLLQEATRCDAAWKGLLVLHNHAVLCTPPPVPLCVLTGLLGLQAYRSMDLALWIRILLCWAWNSW
jgi:hypothetical protein